MPEEKGEGVPEEKECVPEKMCVQHQSMQRRSIPGVRSLREAAIIDPVVLPVSDRFSYQVTS